MTRFLLVLGVVLAVVAVPGVAGALPDPAGDVTTCPGMNGATRGEAPDLIAAAGEVVELGTSIRWTLRFARPLTVPDDEGKPFRVDVLVYDATVPKVSLGYYHGLNRLLRYDAVADPVMHTLLLPELGESRFLPPLVDGGDDDDPDTRADPHEPMRMKRGRRPAWSISAGASSSATGRRAICSAPAARRTSSASSSRRRRPMRRRWRRPRRATTSPAGGRGRSARCSCSPGSACSPASGAAGSLRADR